MRDNIEIQCPGSTPPIPTIKPTEQTEPSLLDIINWAVEDKLRELGFLPEVEDDD